MKKKKETSDDKIASFLAKARERLEYEIKADSENRREAKECLMFTVPGNQWNKKEKEDRARDGRPCLEVSLIPKFIAQVVGDMLHNRARVSVKPVDSKADPQIAKIRGGIIKNTEYISNAEDIYLEAGKMQVTAGYGAWRVGTRYCEDNPFLQEIYMEGIPDPFMVYIDSRRKDAAGSDARYGFVLEKMLKDDFKEYWPDEEMPGKIPQDSIINVWYDDKTVTVAEYFIVKPEKQEFCQFEDGTVHTKKDAERYIADWKDLYEERLRQIQEGPGSPLDQAGGMATPSVPPAAFPQPPQGQPAQPPPAQQPPPIPQMPPEPKIIKRRTTPVNRIRHYTITMDQILPPRKDGWTEYREEDKLTPENLLEGDLVPGKYIPIVEVSGPTLNIEGKTYRKGLMKDAKDPQRLVNYLETSLAETIAIQPKSPWMATPGQIEGFQEDYVAANTKNLPVMFYNPVTADNGALIPPPMRQQPGQPPVALFTQVQRSHDNLKAVLGMFGGDVGEIGPERSAPAVQAKQKPGDISTYVYGYNLNRAIEHSGKIINSMIPEIYDSERDVRIRNADDTETTVPINTNAESVHKKINANPNRYKGLNPQDLTRIIQQKGKGAAFNDITVGKYDIVVTVGPSYSTQRQETSQMLMMMSQSDPKGMAQFRDILFENMDFKDADRMASRARKTLPAGMVKLKEGETPFQPPPNPVMIAQMQKIKTEQAKEKTAQAKEQVALLQAKVKMIELYKETKETDKGVRAEILKVLAELHQVEPNAAAGLPGV